MDPIPGYSTVNVSIYSNIDCTLALRFFKLNQHTYVTNHAITAFFPLYPLSIIKSTIVFNFTHANFFKTAYPAGQKAASFFYGRLGIVEFITGRTGRY